MVSAAQSSSSYRDPALLSSSSRGPLGGPRGDRTLAGKVQLWGGGEELYFKTNSTFFFKTSSLARTGSSVLSLTRTQEMRAPAARLPARLPKAGAAANCCLLRAVPLLRNIFHLPRPFSPERV